MLGVRYSVKACDLMRIYFIKALYKNVLSNKSKVLSVIKMGNNTYDVVLSGAGIRRITLSPKIR